MGLDRSSTQRATRHGAAIHVAKMDVSFGGARLVRREVNTPGGRRQMQFTGEHLEVVEALRLAYPDSMSDEDGKPLTPSAMGTADGHYQRPVDPCRPVAT